MAARATRAFIVKAETEAAQAFALRATPDEVKNLSVQLQAEKFWKLKAKAAENRMGMKDMVAAIVDAFLANPHHLTFVPQQSRVVKNLSAPLQAEKFWTLKVKAAENQLGMKDMVTAIVDDFLANPYLVRPNAKYVPPSAALRPSIEPR